MLQMSHISTDYMQNVSNKIGNFGLVLIVNV